MFLETIKVVDGEIFHLDYHQRRYESVVKSLGAVPLNLAKFINPPKQKGVLRCRLLYDAVSIYSVEYFPYKQKNIEQLKVVETQDIEYSKKYANREPLERLYAQKERCDDILIVIDGRVSDISIANVAFLQNGVWYTPKQPLLAGTTRERLLKDGTIVAKEILLRDIYEYERVALLNAMIDFAIIPQQNIREIIC